MEKQTFYCKLLTYSSRGWDVKIRMIFLLIFISYLIFEFCLRSRLLAYC